MTRAKAMMVLLLVAMVPSHDGHAQRVDRARIAPLPISDWTDTDREILGAMARNDQTIDVFKTCLRNRELCRNWMPFTRYVLGADSGLAARERELLILRTSALCHADYDWAHHVPAARRAGLTDEEILRIAKGPDAPGWSALDRTVLRAADELHADQHISDRTWAALKDRYDDSQMMDVVFTVGQYTMVSMFLNSAGVQLEPGLTGLPR